MIYELRVASCDRNQSCDQIQCPVTHLCQRIAQHAQLHVGLEGVRTPHPRCDLLLIHRRILQGQRHHLLADEEMKQKGRIRKVKGKKCQGSRRGIRTRPTTSDPHPVVGDVRTTPPSHHIAAKKIWTLEGKSEIREMDTSSLASSGQGTNHDSTTPKSSNAYSHKLANFFKHTPQAQ